MLEGVTPFQYAYFVESIEDSARWWSRISGAGPFFVAEHHKADAFRYRGQDIEADVSYAFGYAGDAQIQLIEQHDETPSIYLDMFPAGTYGHHHIALLVSDYEQTRDRLLGEGFDLACELHANDIDAAYFDTRSAIGCFTELHSITDRIINTFDRWHRAHLDWDGIGSPLETHVSGT